MNGLCGCRGLAEGSPILFFPPRSFLPGADPERVKREIEEVVGLDCSRAIMASAKQGLGIEEILEEVVRRVPPPADNRGKPLRALIFDSYYDSYKVGDWLGGLEVGGCTANCVFWWWGCLAALWRCCLAAEAEELRLECV